MASLHSHAHSHDHGHHHHGPAAPHPAQKVGWSILRMALPGRLVVALAISVVMWAFVLLAMR